MDITVTCAVSIPYRYYKSTMPGESKHKVKSVSIPYRYYKSLLTKKSIYMI